MATRLIYSASSNAVNDDLMPPTKKRKHNDDNATLPSPAAPSRPFKSAKPAKAAPRPAAQAPSSTRPQRQKRTSYKDFGNISASDDEDDDEFNEKANKPSAPPPVEELKPSRQAQPLGTGTLEYTENEKPLLLLFRRPPGETKRFFFTTEQLTVMNEWLIQHLDNPYPTDADRDYLVSAIDLPWGKINTWITNARRRVVGKLIEQRERGELPAIFSSGNVRPPIARRLEKNNANSSGEDRWSAADDEEEAESDDAVSAPAAGDEMQVDAQTGGDASQSARDIDLDL